MVPEVLPDLDFLGLKIRFGKTIHQIPESQTGHFFYIRRPETSFVYPNY